MSADSGLKTFRDEDGLWEGHDVMQVASPHGFAQNPDLVFEFYNQRRRQLLKAYPNKGHEALVQLEAHYEVSIITQNVDDLHERAGSTHVVHLHGELFKVRSTGNPSLVLDWKEDLILGASCPDGHQLRPHIVWFGEDVPLLPLAANITATADLLLVIGTSLQVYPAAGLIHYSPPGIPIYLVDPKPTLSEGDLPNLTVMAKKAAEGVPILVADLIRKAT